MKEKRGGGSKLKKSQKEATLPRIIILGNNESKAVPKPDMAAFKGTPDSDPFAYFFAIRV